MAANATIWVYRELGWLKGRRLPHPDRWKPDPVGRKLLAFFSEKLLPDAERRIRGEPDPRYRAVKDACIGWAHKKAGHTFSAVVLGNHLGGLALDVLFNAGVFGVVPTIQAAAEVLKERERALPSNQDLRCLDALLQKCLVTKKTPRAAMSEAQLAGHDLTLNVLKQLFSNRHGHWRNFFDRRGRVRSKKLRSLAEARQNLVNAFK